jgi:ABC-type multidrug transport system fused ATPase/permease subunit
MVFNDTAIGLILVILTLWNAVISYILFRAVRHYNKLTGGSSNTTLSQVLEHLLNLQSVQVKAQEKLERNLRKLETESQFHIQRVAIIRYNPFSDTGGSQSFTFALLDKKDNGVVITSLYARSGNRWYIKQVKEGHGVGLDLSREEESAIQKAKPVDDKPN